MSLPIGEIKIKEEYKELVPRPATEEYDKLKNDIKERGIEEPVVINQSYVLVDGYTRYQIAEELNIDRIPVQQRNFETCFDEQSYVIRKVIMRRNLTSAQKADIAIKLLEVEKKRAKERKKATFPKKGQKGFQKNNDMFPENNTLEKGSSRDKVTKEVGISPKTLKTALDVKQIERILEKPKHIEAVKDVWKDILAGDKPVKEANDMIEEFKSEESGEEKPEESKEPIKESDVPECVKCGKEGRTRIIILCGDCFDTIQKNEVIE